MQPYQRLHAIKLTYPDDLSHTFSPNQPSNLDKMLERVKGYMSEPYQVELITQMNDTDELVTAARDFQRFMERSGQAAIMVEPLTELLMQSTHALIMACGHADIDGRPQDPVAIHWIYQVSGVGLALSSGIKIGDTPWNHARAFVAKH